MGCFVLLHRYWIALCFTSSLLLASCADSPLGQSLQKSLEADPKLQPTATPTVQASATPTPTASPSVSPSTISSPQDPDLITLVQPFRDRLALGLIGDATGVQSPDLASGLLPPDPAASKNFSDLDKIPTSLRSYVEAVIALGVLTPASPKPNATPSPVISPTTNPTASPTASPSSQASPSATLFAPNQIITRRDYARWLVAVNNRLQSNQPAQQVRLGLTTAQPAFQDVSRSDADFAIIQGLAEAGLVPSPLSGDSTTVVFRPNEPLTREQLLLWKVPMDMRQTLPPATLEAVIQTWGFQDAARIEPKALRAVLADFQNGDLSNIRRVFGYTTLFQPKKPVTRAEAAAALWYFGFQGEGRSAEAVLKSDTTEKP